MTRTAKPALDLIIDEDCADLVTALTERLQERWGRDVDSALALDRLNNYAACVLIDQFIDGCFVIIGAVLESRDHWGEGFLIFGIWGGGQCPHGPSVEGIVEGHDVAFVARRTADLADLPSEFDGGFVRFGARVADKDLGGRAHGASGAGLGDDQLGQLANPGIMIQIRSVDECKGLCSARKVSSEVVTELLGRTC